MPLGKKKARPTPTPTPSLPYTHKIFHLYASASGKNVWRDLAEERGGGRTLKGLGEVGWRAVNGNFALAAAAAG